MRTPRPSPRPQMLKKPHVFSHFEHLIRDNVKILRCCDSFFNQQPQFNTAVPPDTEYELTDRESDSMDAVVMAAEEEEARAYKGYNGGNRVWYG